ncbi:hypothetical protein GCM10010172_55030 [Paractinoplanes ferrugineus]|uniref:Uncharacterized protein n=1 Tax=Paractinoplanes ferrugineus TaxID=113564 RepID=A0A919M909_9ACTN|nr:DUF6245 family protein [Actinoplanes ferrugineus]GIE11026.1 hypothetical protein Afe05nite_28660 [Actinoplanes ferrugineus]
MGHGGKAEDVRRLGAALHALGIDEDPPGSVTEQRAWMASVLLGAAQAEAIEADRVRLSREARFALWQRQLAAAEPVSRAELVLWQVRRACVPLPALARENRTDPIPLAAAHAGEALQTLVEVGVATRGAVAAGDVGTLAAQAERLREARKQLRAALDNTDLMLDLLGSVDL